MTHCIQNVEILVFLLCYGPKPSKGLVNYERPDMLRFNFLKNRPLFKDVFQAPI